MWGGLGGADHHACGAVALQGVHELLLALGRLLAVGEKQHQIMGLHLPAKAYRHLGIEGVGDVVQQQADQVAALVAQVGGGLVVDIAQLIDRLEHPLPGLLGDPSLVAQSHGNGGGGDAKVAGDVGYGHITHWVTSSVVIRWCRYID
ncbi:hypothetical protein D3C72_1505350 [compost metagenome]